MIESLITIIFVGLLAGFLFAMPIAGPISIIITSNALKGYSKFCFRTALGASIVESFYVLIAVLGLSALVNLYSPLIPYLLLIGSFFLFGIGAKIAKTNISISDIKSSKGKPIKRRKGGFRTGVIVNLTNPSFFFGVLVSSFLVLSFVSSVGLNTGGLDLLIQENVSSLQEITQDNLVEIDSTYITNNITDQKAERSPSTFLLSLSYAISLGAGSFLWLVILTKLLIKYRTKIKIEILNWIIRSLGIILCGIGIYLLWQTIRILFFS